MRRSEAFLGTAVVAVSAVVNAAHTASHAGQHVMSLPAWQLAYVAVVIYAAPVVAAVLLWTRFSLSGAWLLGVSMAASLAFGLLYHYLIPGPDNVFTQPPGAWGTAFGVTALLLALLQAFGAVFGLWVALRVTRSRVGRAGRKTCGGITRPQRRPGSDPR